MENNDLLDAFSLLTQLARQEFVHILESIPASKELIIESNLMRPLDKLISVSILQRHGCARVQQLHMDKTVIWDEDIDQRVFLVRPTIKIAKKICELIRGSPSRPYSIIFVDRRKRFFEVELERNGLFGSVDFYEFNLSLIPLESDLFSLELPLSTAKIYRQEGEQIARALWHLQTLYGQVPSIFGLGESAREVEAELRALYAEGNEPQITQNQVFSHILVFDRQMDFASVFLTGMTYESILNDMFSYNCGKITFGEAVDFKLKEKNRRNVPKTFPLNNSDLIFSTIRDAHMTEVSHFLSSKAKMLQSTSDKAQEISKVDEMKHFVSNELRSLKEQQRQLELHICACEVVLEGVRGANERFGVEQAIMQGQFEHSEMLPIVKRLVSSRTNAWSVLQLACLWSIKEGGIPQKYYRQLQEMFLNKFGYEYLPAFYRLRLKGLLNEAGPQMPNIPFLTMAHRSNSPPIQPHGQSTNRGLNKPLNISSMINLLKLCPAAEKNSAKIDQNSIEKVQSTEGASYVFSDAYLPLVCRLVEMIVSGEWNTSRLQCIFSEFLVFKNISTNMVLSDNSCNKSKMNKTILVAFVGGVSYAEIAALRRVSRNQNFRIIIVTTNILQREEFLKNLTMD